MAEIDVIFHNKVKIRVQAQIYIDSAIAGSCVAGPGESQTLVVPSERYDIFFKNGTTGWEIARKLNCDRRTFTLIQQSGQFILT